MKIKHLIQELSELDQELDVVLAKDEEGNGFSTLGFVEVSKYDQDEQETIHPDDVDNHDDLIDVVVLWP